MPNEPEQPTQARTDDETSRQSLVDSLYVELGLPRLTGSDVAARYMQVEIVAALKHAGILTDEQINGMLGRVTEKIESHCQALRDIRPDDARQISAADSLGKAATAHLDRIRESVTQTPNSPSQQDPPQTTE